jgi:hypothetical protein
MQPMPGTVPGFVEERPDDEAREAPTVGSEQATELVAAQRPMNRPADVWSVMLAERNEPHFHPVCKYPSVVLTDQFSIATSHGAVGGFCTGGLPCPTSRNMVYFEVEILEVDGRWQSGLGIGFMCDSPDSVAASFGAAAKFPRTAKAVPRNYLLGYDGTLAVVDRQTKYVHPREYIGPPWSPKSLKVGDRLGVCAHKTGLSLWVNGQCRVCFQQDYIKTNQPLYAILELDGRTKSVRMIPKPTYPDIDGLRTILAEKK